MTKTVPYFAAVISGLLIALSFPTIIGGFHFPNLSWLAWFALIPYLLVLRQACLPKIAVLTFIFSVFWNGLTSYWIFNALYFNGQLSLLPSLGVLILMASLLAALQSAFMCVGAVLCRRFRFSSLLIFPSIWTFYEWVRNYWPFGGYPWANLGYSQASSITLLQSADLFGVYGLSFLIVLINVVLAEMLNALRAQKRLPWMQIGIGFSLLLFFLTYGSLRFSQVEVSLKNAETLRVGLLQPNIGQQLKWKQDLNQYIQTLLIKMTHQATEQGAQFVVWPESSLPTALPLHLDRFQPLNEFRVPVLMGVLSLETAAGQIHPILYNSALQVDPGGHFFGRLHKQHLVPLGEYVPLGKIFWFVDPIVHKIGDFRTMPPKQLLRVDDYPYGVSICYEDLFPEISRRFARMGASFLINITNDAWYGDSSQLEQHLNFSKFRAVENRRALVRGTNNGHTAAIDPMGRIHAEIPKFIVGILLTEIPLYRDFSIYTRFGDGFWLAILAIGFILSAVRQFRFMRHK